LCRFRPVTDWLSFRPDKFPVTLVFVSPSGIHLGGCGYYRFPGFAPESLSPAGLSALLPAWGFVVLVVWPAPRRSPVTYKYIG